MKKYFVSYFYSENGNLGCGNITIKVQTFDISAIAQYIAEQLKTEKVIILNFKQLKCGEN